MSNQRSVMTEFRFLDQKRQAEGLTAEEASRYAQLRDLVGAEAPAPARSGFDVNAAAARLRESLLPAGLRSRPPEAAPPPPPPAPEPAPAPAPEALALEAAWAEAPFADLTPAPADPLFDPGSLAQEVRPQAWNPEAPGYDPDAPYDEAAWIAAGYDPNATYDWSAYGYGPDGQPLAVEGAAPAEAAPAPEAGPEAEPPPALDPLAEAAPELASEPAAEPLAWAAEAAPQELLEAPLEPAHASLEVEPTDPFAPALGAEPTAAPPADGDDDGWDATPIEAAQEDWEATPEPAPLEPAAPARAGHELEPEAELTTEVELVAEPDHAEPAAPPAEEALPFDPNAPFDHAKWFGRPAAAGAAPAAPPPEPPGEPLDLDLGLDAPEPPPAEPEFALDLAPEPEPLPEPAPAAAPAFGEYDESAPGAFALSAAPELLPEASLGEPPPLELEPSHGEPLAEAPPAGDAAGDWLGDGSDTPYQPAPEGAAFGEYDEAGAPLAGVPGLDAALPFDAAADAAVAAGETPEGYDPGGPALDLATLPPVELGGYDDVPAFSAGDLHGGPEGEALPGGEPLELGEALPDWQPDAALEAGFELASDGSFGHADVPAGLTPAWGTPAQGAPGDGWESAPALDLSAPFDAGAAAGPAAEELPTIDGAELLEELPPEAAALDLAQPTEPVEPWTPDATPPAAEEPASLEAGFEEAPAVEAAAAPADLAPGFTELPPEPELELATEPFSPPVAAEPLEATEPFAEAPPLETAPATFAEPPLFAPAAAAYEPEAYDATAFEPGEAGAVAFDDASAAAPAPEPFEPAAEPAAYDPAAVEPAVADAGAFDAAAFDAGAPVEPAAEPAAYDAAAVEPAAYEPPDFETHAADTAAWAAAAVAPAFEAGAEAAQAHAEPEPSVTYELPPEGLPPEIAAAYGADPGAPSSDPFAPPPDPFAPHGADTFELPPSVAEGLFAPAAAAEPMEAEPLPAPAPSVQITGSHRVVLHTVDGQVRRGLLVDAFLDAPILPLQPQGPGVAEDLATDGIKAIFFMLSPGEKAPPAEGRKVRVTFRDGRQVAGFSPDYQDGLVGFFMIPADTRTNTGRIWVYQAAVKAVSVS